MDVCCLTQVVGVHHEVAVVPGFQTFEPWRFFSGQIANSPRSNNAKCCKFPKTVDVDHKFCPPEICNVSSRMLFRMCSCTGESIIERNYGRPKSTLRSTRLFHSPRAPTHGENSRKAEIRITSLSTNGMFEITSVSLMRSPCTHEMRECQQVNTHLQAVWFPEQRKTVWNVNSAFLVCLRADRVC